MLKFYFAVLILGCALVFQGEAHAKSRLNAERSNPEIVLVQAEADVSISPAEAADIAQNAVPGSKVLKVKLLSNGTYAVTLKADGSVTRVMVDGNSGSVQ